jgi:hypothetical protein
VLGALTEGAAVGLLADERDHTGPKLARQRLESLGAAGEVPAAQITGAGCRSIGGVRDADPERQQVELLRGLEEPRCEFRRLQEPPEVVPGVRKMRVRRV